jgi:hypothetical protein
MSLGHNLKPLPWGLWEFVVLKKIISGPFNYVEQNSYLRILIGCVRGNVGRERGDKCPPITFGHLKGH